VYLWCAIIEGYVIRDSLLRMQGGHDPLYAFTGHSALTDDLGRDALAELVATGALYFDEHSGVFSWSPVMRQAR
jgi:hypothetical protein